MNEQTEHATALPLTPDEVFAITALETFMSAMETMPTSEINHMAIVYAMGILRKVVQSTYASGIPDSEAFRQKIVQAAAENVATRERIQNEMRLAYQTDSCVGMTATIRQKGTDE